MRKYFILVGIFLCVVVCLNVNLEWDSSMQGKLDITMSNIEALASGEDQQVTCRLPGSLDCPGSAIKARYIQ